MQMDVENSIAGKVAIVTGGASGIGLATAQMLADRGAKVAIVDIDRRAGNSAEKQCAPDVCLKFIEGDATKEAEILRILDVVDEDLGPVSILVNNAAFVVLKGIDATEEEWIASMRGNVIAYALWCKHGVERMRAIGDGRIVNLCSISAHIAQPGFATYSSAKGAVHSLTKCLALDLAPTIRVNSVSPATIWSDSNARFINQKFGFDRSQADAAPEIGGLHVLERCGDTKEVASVITFLCSDASSFITGTDVMVDGGYTLK